MSDNGHKDFEPEITAFTCIYCAYMAADTAGALRIQYPANIKLVKLPCTGKTDIAYMLKAFEQARMACMWWAARLATATTCAGNERARIAWTRYKEDAGRDWHGRRAVEMYFVSGGMGETFAKAAREMTERIRALGPSPLKEMSPWPGRYQVLH